MKRATLVLFTASFLLNCGPPAGGPAGPISGVNPDGSPRWVNRGSGAYDGKHGKAFYGVGLARGIDNPALLRQTADNRARGEIAKIFDAYIAAMMKDYQRSTSAGGASAEEQDVVSAQKTITEVTLRGVEVRDHWTNPADGTFHALAVLDIGNITGALGQAKGLDQRIVDYVRDNARKAFNDLDRELYKRDNPPPPPAPPAPAEPAPPAAETPAPATPAPEPAARPAPRKTGPVRVGLRVTGTRRSIIQTCFANRLINAGYKLFEGTSDVDVMVRGKLTYKKAGVIRGSHMVKAAAEVRVHMMESGETSAAVVETIKVGRPTLNESVQLAVSRLCDRVVPKIVKQIKGGIGR